MDKKNVKDIPAKYAPGHDPIIGDDNIAMTPVRADKILFARLEHEGYTIIRDENGELSMAVAPSK